MPPPRLRIALNGWRLPGIGLAVLVAILAACALAASLAITHRAVVAEQRQTAAVAALQDFSALIAKMGPEITGGPGDAAYMAAWLQAFQSRPGQSDEVVAVCSGAGAGTGLRWIATDDSGQGAGIPALARGEIEPLPGLGDNIVLIRLPRGSLCADTSVDVVAVRERVGSAEVLVARVVERTGRAWTLGAVSVAAMSGLLLGVGLASAAWTRQRLVAGIAKINMALDRAAVGRFEEPVAEAELPSDLRALARHVNLTQDRLRELLTWLRDTSDQLAHDFRTPLARARARLDRLAEAQGKAEREALLADARADLRTLTQTMNEALSLRDGEAWAFEPVRLDQLCAAAIELYQPLAEERQVRLQLTAQPVEVLGVASLLQRAIANLVDNALKYSPDGGVVDISCQREGPRAVVIVADQGPGLGSKAPASAGVTESHRMGLPFVRAIARRHGGVFQIDSGETGAVARFEV